MIDLTKLHTFLRVAETMSFSEAAEHLHLTQPAISHQIRILEQELRQALFDRAGGGLRLTEAGNLLLPRARKLVREAIEIQQLMASLDTQICGHLRIACSTTTGKYITSQFAARFHKRHPEVSVSVLSCNAPNVIQTILCEEADLGVISYEALRDGIECQSFFNDHIVLIAPAEHPWATRPYIDPAELLLTPLIVREPTSGTRHALLAELGKHCITFSDLNIFMEIGNSEAIVRTVEAGYGVSFVSRLAAKWALGQGTVVEIPVTDVNLHRTLYLIRPEIHKAHRAIDIYWGFVRNPSNLDLLQLAEE